MRSIVWVTLLLLAVGMTGCSRTRRDTTKIEPLSVEQWTALPPTSKYDVDTLERVKASDPKFQDEQRWDEFARGVVVPAKRRDIAAGNISQ